MKAYIWTIIGLSGLMVLGGCNQRRSGNDNNSGENSEQSSAESPDSFGMDDSGTARLLPPDDLQKRKGVTVTNEEHANLHAKSARPGNNWIYYETPKGDGSFLIAAASKPNSQGGDMSRRIDAKRRQDLEEFDFDSENPGKQGAYIYVPDEMRKVVPSKYIDSDGLFSGIICAFVPGPYKSIIALAGGTEGGVGFVLNPYEESQAFTPLQAIQFPYASNPCRAVYSDELKKLYVVDVVRTESNGGQEGIMVADIYTDKRSTVASFYHFDAKSLVNNYTFSNFQGLDLYNDTLYLLSGNGRFDSEWDAVVYRVPLNKAGEPIFKETKFTRTNNPIVRSEGCNLSTWNIGAIAVVDTGSKPVLLTSGTANTVAWEITDNELKKIDLDEKRPGVQGFDFRRFGQGALKFEYERDGSVLYQLPHCRSRLKYQEKDETFMNFAVTGISSKDFKQKGAFDLSYQALLKNDLSSAPYKPQFTMTLRDFAVGPRYVAALGNSASNLSGLSAGSDVIIYDREESRTKSFIPSAEIKQNIKRAHELHYGFKLAQGDPQFNNIEQHSHAVIWIP